MDLAEQDLWLNTIILEDFSSQRFYDSVIQVQASIEKLAISLAILKASSKQKKKEVLPPIFRPSMPKKHESNFCNYKHMQSHGLYFVREN